MLIEKNAGIDIQNIYGQTAMIMALDKNLQQEDTQIYYKALEKALHLAENGANFNLLDNKGTNAFIIIAENKDFSFLLLYQKNNQKKLYYRIKIRLLNLKNILRILTNSALI